MADETNQIKEILSSAGISSTEATIYSTLLEADPLTILELSRRVRLPRTNLYRLLEKMKTAGLVEEVVDQYKTKVQAVGLDRLEMALKAKEQSLSASLADLAQIKATLATNPSLHQPGTKVVFFRGAEGIKQILWNELQASRLIQSYSFQNVQEITGDKFIVDWHREWQATGVKIRDLVSDHYLRNRVKTRHLDLDWTNIERRYLPNRALDINTAVEIYNDVVVYFNWHGDEIFGVEIHNKEVAELQKQMHDHFWRLAAPMTKTTSDEKRGLPVKRASQQPLQEALLRS